MKVVFYTAGMTGSGHMVKGISIANALRRKGVKCEYVILHGCSFSGLAEKLGVQQIKIHTEDEIKLSRKNYSSSELYNTLVSLKPDILLVDLFWFMIHHFIDELSCKKIFLCRQVVDSTFFIHLESGAITFNPESYDRVLAVEPFKSGIEMEHINPIIIRNRDDILSREDALETLGLKKKGKNASSPLTGGLKSLSTSKSSIPTWKMWATPWCTPRTTTENGADQLVDIMLGI